jgi:hypothetical protein
MPYRQNEQWISLGAAARFEVDPATFPPNDPIDQACPLTGVTAPAA